jgi:hypothetical protein
LLRHAFAHCGRFVTAASRRSPNSVSVSMWRAMLSHPLPVKGLVSRYLTNYLIGRSPLSRRQAFDLSITSGITQSFPWLSPTLRYVGTHYSPFRRSTRGLLHFRARLACFSHAASVQSEPGSNSSIDCLWPRPRTRSTFKEKGSPGNHSLPGRERMVGHAGTTIRRQRAANPLDFSRTSCLRRANPAATRSSLN